MEYVSKYKLVVKLMCLCILGIIIFLISMSCTHTKKYTSSIGNSTFSFEYMNSDQIYKYPLHEITFDVPGPPKPLLDSNIISILKSTSPGETIYGVDSLISSIQNRGGISSFKIGERGTLKIKDADAEYTKFSYTGYDLRPVSYYGVFLSTSFNGYSVNIEILGTSPIESSFKRLINTLYFVGK